MNCAEVFNLIGNRSVLLADIRDPGDQVNGVIEGAVFFTSDQLVAESNLLASNYKQVVIICYKGVSSRYLCDQLGSKFVSMDGGFEQWVLAKLPIEKPQMHSDQIRYQQQIKLNGFGQSAQAVLSRSHVLVVGAGGLGAPALLYLAASGVGQITLVDDDEVSLSNLHRQVIYNEHDIGQKKAIQAGIKLKELNSSIVIRPICERLCASNVSQLLDGVDLVVDGSDNVLTRYLINDQCNRSAIPWVFAAVSGFEVQVAVFGSKRLDVCYRCLFDGISDQDAGNCSQEGVLGSVPGMAAMFQVTEAIKFLTGMKGSLYNKMLSYNVLDHQFKVLKYPPNLQCQHR